VVIWYTLDSGPDQILGAYLVYNLFSYIVSKGDGDKCYN
jgi:hypothetical protein